MVSLDFSPTVGEQVLGPPSDERYEVLDRSTNLAGEILLKIRRLRDGGLFENVPPVLLKYPLDEQVRRVLHKLLHEGTALPEDFQGGRFKVVSNEMYDGTPGISAYFYLKPEIVPSLDRARVWNEFYRKLHVELDPLVDDPQSPTWLQFMTREAGSPLSVAS